MLRTLGSRSLVRTARRGFWGAERLSAAHHEPDPIRPFGDVIFRRVPRGMHDALVDRRHYSLPHLSPGLRLRV
jgi:hypothetical protein